MLGLLPLLSVAYADDFEYGAPVVVNGNTYVCGSHDDWRLLWSAIDRHDTETYRARMKSGSCGFLEEGQQLTDCEFKGRVSPIVSVARCVIGPNDNQSVRNLYLLHGSLVSKYKPKEDANFTSKFASDLAMVKAEQDRMRAELATERKKNGLSPASQTPGK